MRLLPLLLACFPITALADPLTIVTDIPPVQSLVLQVAGDRGSVSVLLEQNADPHHFQLRPSQARQIANADLLIWIGEEMTPWLARTRKGVASDVPHLEFMKDEDHAVETDKDHIGEAQDEQEHHHEDPHFWLDTHEAIEMVGLIEHRISELDPDGAEFYHHNAAVAVSEIQSLTQEVSTLLAGVPEVPFAVTHDGFRYFVDQFGLNQVGNLTGIQDSGASAKTVSKLAEMTQNGEISCVFGEVAESNKLAQVLVDEGAKLGQSLDAAGITLERGPTLYRDLILRMALSFKDCLSD